MCFYNKIPFRLTPFKLFICNYLKTQWAHFTFLMLHSCPPCVFLNWGRFIWPGSQPGLQLHPGCSIQASRHDGRGGDLHQGGVPLQAAQQIRTGPGRQIHPQISGRRLRPDRGETCSGGSFVTVSLSVRCPWPTFMWEWTGMKVKSKMSPDSWPLSSSLSFYIYVFSKEHSLFCHYYYFPFLTEELSKYLEI